MSLSDEASRLMRLDAWTLLATEFALGHRTLCHPWLSGGVTDFLAREGYERVTGENYKLDAHAKAYTNAESAARYLRFVEAVHHDDGYAAIVEHLMARYALFTL